MFCGGHYRVFVMGSESWINLVKSLKEKFGSAADSILHTEGIPAGEAMATRGIERRVDERVKEDDAGKRTINMMRMTERSGFNLRARSATD